MTRHHTAGQQLGKPDTLAARGRGFETLFVNSLAQAQGQNANIYIIFAFSELEK